MLDLLKRKNKTVGIKQTAKAVEQALAATVFIAADADDRVVSRFRELCGQNGIDVIVAESMKVLGKACGIDVGAAVAAILKD